MVGACLFVLLSVVWLVAGLAHGTASSSLVALVHDSEGGTHELSLDDDTSLVVETPLGRNVIVVKDGEVRMAEADCPNGNCLRQHAISSPGEQIICLPHKLWIEVVAEGEGGGEMDVDAVTEAPDDVDLQAS